MVQKTSRKNVMSTVLMDIMGGKNHNELNRTALKQNKMKHMRTRKELQAH